MSALNTQATSVGHANAKTNTDADIAEARHVLERLHASMRGTIRGKDEVIELVLVCLAAGGHVLIEDLPGVGKTTLAYALARSMDCSFARIQFTSDLLPSDVTGVSIYDDRTHEFVFKKGPVFAQVVLADEINRTSPKTQSALLEVMERARVSVDGKAHEVGAPFMVFATQNPIDFEGTFPLPESQLDRFLMRLRMGYPQADAELEILRAARIAYDAIELNSVASPADVVHLQELARHVFIEDSVLGFVLKITVATRTASEFRAGCSVRGGLALKAAAQARALFHGRDFVTPEDVLALVPHVLGHRLMPVRAGGDVVEDRRTVASVLRRIVSEVQI